MFNLFRPAPPRTITVSPAGRQFSARKGGVLLEEALLAGVPLPHNCTVGTCGACKCRLTEGKIVELTRSGRILWSFGTSSGPDRLDRPSLATR